MFTDCRQCGEMVWSTRLFPICEPCEVQIRGYAAGARNALAEASVADLVAELGRRAGPGLPSEAEVARLVASQEERLRALEALAVGQAEAVALVQEAVDLLTDTAVSEVGETRETWVSLRRAVVLGRHVGAAEVQQWTERAGALLGNSNSSRRTG